MFFRRPPPEENPKKEEAKEENKNADEVRQEIGKKPSEKESQQMKIDEEEEGDVQIEMNPRPSKFAILLSKNQQQQVGRERESSSPMIESDTSTEAEEETNEFEQELIRKRQATKTTNNTGTKRKKKMRMKRKSTGGNEGKENDDENWEDFLRELERKEHHPKRRNSSSGKITKQQKQQQQVFAPPTASPLDQLLGIDSRFLITEDQQQRPTQSLRQNRPDHRGHLAPPLGRIVQSRVNWPRPKSLGFQMIVDAVDEDKSGRNEHQNDIKWFRFWHKEAYQRQQQLFWLHQQQADLAQIMTEILNQQNPYHLDSLMLLADLFERQGDAQGARDFIERGIFACEFVAHPTFQPFASNHRLDYACCENRPFFLLLHQLMLTNMREGKYRTALELAKLIYAKDPDGDPMAIMLLIDALALRANCPNFLLDFYGLFCNSKRLDLLPNFRFSLVLALRQMGQEEEAIQYLEEAYVHFPFMLCQILDHLQLQADPVVDRNYYLNSLAAYRETEGMRQLAQVYLHHSAEFWRPTETLNWLEMATHRVLPNLQTLRRTEMDEWAKRRKNLFIGLPENVSRHCLLHRILVPETLLQDAKVNLGDDPITDPCPPKNGHQQYSANSLDDTDFPLLRYGIYRRERFEAARQRREPPANADENPEAKGWTLMNGQELVISFCQNLLPQWIKDFLLQTFHTIRQILPAYRTNNYRQ